MDCVTYLEAGLDRPTIALLVHIKSVFTKTLATRVLVISACASMPVNGESISIEDHNEQ
jgi:hypothetical protein